MEKDLIVHWTEDGVKQAHLSIGGVSSCLCTIYHNGKARVMVIDSVETAKTYRHRGYGRKLMEETVVFAKAQQVDSVELVVNQDNAVAIKLYENAGFKRIDKFFYRLILNTWQT